MFDVGRREGEGVSPRIMTFSVCSYTARGVQPRQLAFDPVQLPTRSPAGPVDRLGHPAVVTHPQSLAHPSQRHRRPPPKPPRQHHFLRRTLGHSPHRHLIQTQGPQRPLQLAFRRRFVMCRFGFPTVRFTSPALQHRLQVLLEFPQKSFAPGWG